MFPASLLVAACAPDIATPAVVLVSLDTLRADRLGAYGNPDGLTPNLDRLAGEAVVFERAYAQATDTARSHGSLLSSRYPSELHSGGRAIAYGDGMPTLAEVLGTYGWQTAAYVSGGDLAPELGVGRGFGTWTSVGDFASLWHSGPPALAWIDAHAGDAPWLLLVHGYDAHTPYLRPTPYGYARTDPAYAGLGHEAVLTSTERIVDGRLHADQRVLEDLAASEAHPRSPSARARLVAEAEAHGAPGRPLTAEDEAHVRAVYDGAAAYADTQLGLLLAGLQERGVLDRAWLVVFSDHGEALGEGGHWNHCCGVSDAEAHVVLMVRAPGGAGGGRRVPALVELVDVMPTVLEWAGVPAPTGIHGRSLGPALRGEPFPGRDEVYTQGGVGGRQTGARTATGRLVWEGLPVFAPLNTALAATAPLPGPDFTVEGLADADAEALRRRMVRWMAALTPSVGAAARPLPDKLRAALRERGYFGEGLEP